MIRQILCIVCLCGIFLLGPVSGRHSRYHNHRNHRDETRQVSVDEKLALEHSERVAEAGTCDQPKLQVIHVSDHYPGRYFLPHCTMLHRCGKHAGCCGTDRLRCVAKEKQKVVLHFYSVKILDGGELPVKKIEKLTFTNHTKCGCAPVEHFSKHDL